MIQDENKKFWDNRAEQHTGHEVSWWDINMKKIEINTISKYLTGDDYVLDIGCSNGASTKVLQQMTGAKFFGIDYSEKAIRQSKTLETDRLKFEYKDILEFNQKSTFDKAVSIRALINLMDVSDHRKYMEIVCNALKPGGTYIMCEAFSGAFNNLNNARAMFGLKPLSIPIYNRYIDEDKMDQLIDGLFKVENIVRHSSLYYVGTRIFQYMSMDNDPCEFDTELHRFFGKYGFETKNSGDFGPNKTYILKKI